MLLAALLATLFLVLILWFIPRIYVRSLKKKSLSSTQSEFDREKEKLKLEDDTRKTLAQIIGGAVFLFGVIFTYNTFVLNREGQITERFTQAAEQLGNDDIAVRLGGLYALERIAKDSPKDHWTIMEIVSAYIRERSPNTKPAKVTEKPVQKEPGGLKQNKKPNSDKIKTDIQAAMTIIGRRIIGQDPPGRRIDLRDSNLSGTGLSGANLSGANFSEANLSEANLFGADLFGADLSEAYLRGADLRGTNLSASQNLSYEEISKATIDEETKLPEDLKSQRDTILELSKKNLEKQKRLFR